MLRAIACLPALALVLAGCGGKQLSLPEDPVDRAATCGVIAAIQARLEVGAKGELPFARQLGVLHYALLEGAEGKGFDRERASAVSKRMPQLADPLTDGDKWKALQAPCAEAFPATQVADPALPAKAADAQLGCYVLADFVVTALQGQDAAYGSEISRMNAIKRALDTRLGARFGAKGQGSVDAQSKARDAALATMAKAGPPAKLLDQCHAKYAKEG